MTTGRELIWWSAIAPALIIGLFGVALLGFNAAVVVALWVLRGKRRERGSRPSTPLRAHGVSRVTHLPARPEARRAFPYAVPSGVVDIDLRGGRAAPARARGTLRPLLDDGDPAVLEAALQLMSEAVTNCVVHGGADESTRIAVRIRIAADIVHVEVANSRRRFMPAAQPADDLDTSQGARILEALADRWDAEQGDVTRVWFELERARSSRALHSAGS